MTVRVGVIFFSVDGATEALANAIVAGAGVVDDVDVLLRRISGAAIDQGRYRDERTLAELDGCTGLIFGSPTWMGGPPAPFKAFADATSERWIEQRWRDKLAAGFTVGANPAGDQLATLQYFALLASQLGMLWTGLDIAGGFDPHGRNRLGSQLGVAPVSTVNIRTPTISLPLATSASVSRNCVCGCMRDSGARARDPRSPRATTYHRSTDA